MGVLLVPSLGKDYDKNLGYIPLSTLGDSPPNLLGATDSLQFIYNDFNTTFLQYFLIHFTLSPLESHQR